MWVAVKDLTLSQALWFRVWGLGSMVYGELLLWNVLYSRLALSMENHMEEKTGSGNSVYVPSHSIER